MHFCEPCNNNDIYRLHFWSCRRKKRDKSSAVASRKCSAEKKTMFRFKILFENVIPSFFSKKKKKQKYIFFFRQNARDTRVRFFPSQCPPKMKPRQASGGQCRARLYIYISALYLDQKRRSWGMQEDTPTT